MNRPQGFLTVSKVHLEDGREISTQEAVDRQLVVPVVKVPRGWGIEKHEIPLGFNLFTDSGRQAMAYLLGYRSPASSYAIRKVGFGTGTSAPRITDVSLESPIDLGGEVYTKDINGIDYPAAFVIRVEFTIGTDEANGYLITEIGLFTETETLIAHKVLDVGLAKSSSIAPTLIYRLRV